MVDTSAVLARLEDQIAWYDRKSQSAQRSFKTLRLSSVAAAACVPIAASTENARFVASALGVLIVLLEAVQQVNQYHHNWIAYRSTCEALKHEKYLYLGAAGPYANLEAPVPLLAERVEGLVSQENAKWLSGAERARGASASTVNSAND